ncbi:hypothetical protein TRFO_01068 [Tritrichomonas foetus]|uniref:Glycosyltransferase RgtA/B/C/D-like domain-containing protein n=1 Tax=Tritrichomonas foetus TaxID=1144522 RepID=A0A1J4KN88_9EUKA|nr:hypothetical protein TRFO_01068 [Tritrichomonas foetus]|eukprot:OHT11166.1 hypothetical protein TRFO_01068 [Tritrichomonas foetus]
MIWAFIITSSIWLGYEIINLLAPPIWDQIAVLSGAVPFGFTISSYIFFFVRKIIPLNSFIGIIISSLCFIVSYFIHTKNKKRNRFRHFSPTFAILLSVLFIIYMIVVSRAILRNGSDSAGTTYSDLPFHMSLVASFAYGANSKNSQMHTPFYAGHILCYPIIPDFFSAVLVGCGNASLRMSIAIPTVLLFLSLTFALHTLALHYTKMKYIPEVSIIFFLLASGTGWRYLFLKRCRNNVNSNMVHTFCDGAHTFWIHSLIHFLLPQRSAAFSMPVCVLITSLLVYVVENIARAQKPALLAGLLMGILPLLSAHSYIGVGEYAIFIALFNFPFKQFAKWKVTITTWCFFGVTAIIISLPQVLWLMREKRSSFFSIKPIYLETDSSKLGFFKVWWSSLGAFVFIALFCAWTFTMPHQNRMYLPSIGVWIVSNFIRYQPGAMDNTKVFYAGWYPIACISVANFIITLWKRTPKMTIKILVSLVVFGFSIGSMICIKQAMFQKFPLYSKDEKHIGIWFMENTAKDSVTITTGWHANTIMSIGGRVITIGYPGWIWTHGFDYYKRVSEIKEMERDKENETIFKPLNIKYVMSKSDDKDRNFEWKQPGPNSRWICLIDIGNIKIYRILHNVI